MELKKSFFPNKYGVKICMCCASCKHKQLDKSLRICKKGEGQVPPSYLCPDWEMKEDFDNAGKGGGDIKRRDYLEYALERLSADEYEALVAAEKKLPYKRVTIFEIREEFKKIHGSIYVSEK